MTKATTSGGWERGDLRHGHGPPHDFPTRPGFLDMRLGGLHAFVAKLEPVSGSAQAYATYLAGSNWTRATELLWMQQAPPI